MTTPAVTLARQSQDSLVSTSKPIGDHHAPTDRTDSENKNEPPANGGPTVPMSRDITLARSEVLCLRT